MSDKKHIDRLFQEKFKDFEVKPKANVWANIESELKQPKQKTTLIPLWLRYAGVAAMLLLFLTIGNSFFNNTNPTLNNSVVDTEKENNVRGVNNDDIDSIDNSSTSKDITNTSDNLSDNNISVVGNDEISDDVNSLNENSSDNKNISKAKNNKNEGFVTSTVSNSKTLNKINLRKNLVNNKNNNSVTPSNYSSQISGNTVVNNESSKINAASNKNLNTNPFNKNVGQELNSDTKNSNNVTQSNKKTINKNNLIKPFEALNKNQTDEATLVENAENNIKTKDSTNTNNTIENAIAKIEDLIEKEEETVNRWTVNANVAPVYYNTLGKGSHIDDQFIDNPKNGEINTSYGVKVGYALNDKLKVRSGVNKLNLSYDTANVIVFNNVSNTPNTSSLRNINFVPDNQGQAFSVLSADNLQVQQISEIFNDRLNAALSQRISYIEVPLELEYALVDKKLGVNVIGGASAFILSDNEVVSEVENRKTKIGEANNINNISYSANIGLGIDYKFSEKLHFNLEPTFKYQMNAYSETSGDFRPYIIGVYTGFSYKF